MESLEKELLQWIKGEKIGNVETVKGIDNEWTMFESGGRIYTELINEFLSPVQGEPLDFGLTPTAVVNPTPLITPPITPTNTQSPIRTLFDKQKKNDKIKLNLTFPIIVPKNAIYEIISSSFDLGEVNDELESFIKDQISEDLILDSLFDSIKELVKTKYKID
jgi:hypothetical protein